MLFSSRISASCCTAARRATRGDRLKAFGSSPMVDAMAYSVRLAHLDGHLNMHLHPMVLPILLELAPRYALRAMRLSREDLGAALRYDRSHFARKVTDGVVFQVLAGYAAPRLGGAGIATAARGHAR